MIELPHQNILLLKVYLYFRTILAILLAGMFYSSIADNILGTQNANLFYWVSSTYVALCSLTIVLMPAEKLVGSINRLIASLVLDIVTVILLLHASGGIDSGLGYLLLIFVAMGGIFIRGQRGIALAAMASLLVMGESIYSSQVIAANDRATFSAGSLGIMLFATAFAFQRLTETIRTSNLEAAAQAAFAEHLQELAQAIVTRMRTGILVVDDDGRIELINESALQLLDLPKDLNYRDRYLQNVPSLQPIAEMWQDTHQSGPPQVQELRIGQKARISLSTLDLGSRSRTVFYLEDHRVMTQQAQQLKLASLGRLTASIAHEIRNPLGAISHAAQLLAESPDIAPSDQRLTTIIHHHSDRVNQIVESTLALSRRKEPQAETLDLAQWLPRFTSQYKMGQNAQIEVHIQATQHLIKMDPTHLSQVLTNLLDNGLRYSRQATGEAKVLVWVAESENDDTTYVEIVDFGAGVEEQRRAQVFDPFYTTDAQGSGLGLYISKELCEINQASLSYRPDHLGRSCFRIDFTHHQRMF